MIQEIQQDQIEKESEIQRQKEENLQILNVVKELELKIQNQENDLLTQEKDFQNQLESLNYNLKVYDENDKTSQSNIQEMNDFIG